MPPCLRACWVGPCGHTSMMMKRTMMRRGAITSETRIDISHHSIILIVRAPVPWPRRRFISALIGHAALGHARVRVVLGCSLGILS